jgi:hypothetical protein
MNRTGWLWTLTIAWAALNVAADVVVGVATPGLTVVIGFAGCFVIVYFAKWIGTTVLQRPEGYYEQLEGAPIDDEGGHDGD